MRAFLICAECDALCAKRSFMTAMASATAANDGGVSKCGDALLRTMLYEAAHSLLTHSGKWSWLKAWGVRVAQRRGIRRAIVAVARRLAVVLHRMWVDGSEFRWSKDSAAVPMAA